MNFNLTLCIIISAAPEEFCLKKKNLKKKKNHEIEIKNSAVATAVTGKAQAPGDFSLLSLRYYILFYDWSFVYWNYLPLKKEIKLKKKFEDSVHRSQLTDFKRLESCWADRNTCSFQQILSFQYNHFYKAQETGCML